MENKPAINSKRRISKKIWGILILGLLIQILFDPISELLLLGENVQARIGLPFARAKWEKQNITHYRFDIQGYVPLVCIFGGNIEVEDEKIIRTGPRSDSNETLLLSPGFNGLSNPESPPLCDLHNYTMTLLFDELERWLRESPSSVTQISFDSKYGFISHFGFGSSGGLGILSPIVSDCCGGFTIANFQALGR